MSGDDKLMAGTMKVLDFTKETDELENKLIKLGFHYQSTDKEERPPKPARLITTWVNVMNGVTLKNHRYV